MPNGPVTHSGTFGERAPNGAPDFLIRTANGTLGIEHREVLKPEGGRRQHERAHEQRTDDVIAMAQELSNLWCLPLARVSVHFHSDVPDKRPDRLALARGLVQLVHDRMPEDRGHVRLEYMDFQGRQMRGVDVIFIHRDDRLTRSGHWVATRAGFVVSDCVDLFQEAIDDKAHNFPAYIRHCDKCWLLLVADSMKPSASIHPDERSLGHKYRSPFARTYFLDFGMGTLHALAGGAS